MKEKERFDSFDVLKYLAVLVTTVVGHYFQFTPAGLEPACETAFLSSVGKFLANFTLLHTHTLMEFLFLAGGFQIYLAYHDRITENKISFFDYFKKRFIRLYPPMIISVLVMSAGLLLFKRVTGEEWRGIFFTFKGFVMSLLGTQAWASDIHVINGPLWYLSVYILCVILYFFLEKASVKYNLHVTVLFVPVVAALCHYFDPTTFTFIHMDVTRGLYAFFLGSVFACAYRYFEKKQLTVYCAVSIAVCILLYIVKREELLFDGTERAVLLSFGLYGPLLIILALYKKIDRLIGIKPLKFLGKTTFHLYCANFPVLLWIKLIDETCSLGINFNLFSVFVVTTLLQMGIAVLMYYLVDEKLCKKLAEAINKLIN